MSNSAIYISQIKLPDNTVYSIKDAEARELIAEIAAKGISFVISTNAANTPYGVQWDDDGTTITGTLAASAEITSLYLVPAKVDNRTFYAEYACIKLSDESYVWEKLGDTDVSFDSLGSLAYQNSASGTISVVSAVSSAFTGSAFTSSGSYTPAGAVAASITTSTLAASGSIVAEGVVSKPNVDVTTTSAAVSLLNNGGTVVAGSAASFTSGSFNGGSFAQGTDTFSAPVLTTTVSSEVLTIAFDAGSFTQGTDTFSAATHGDDTFNANTPTSVTLPTFSSVNVLAGVSAELAAAPEFTGSAVSVNVTADPSALTLSAAFTGSAANIEVTGTATGTISNTYTTTSTTVTVS